MHRHYGAKKSALFSTLPSTIVELGPGCGANFRYLRPGTRVIAIEPNQHMHPALHAAARRHQLELDVSSERARLAELDSGSVGAVIATLVLCTVDDPAATLREVHRVLQPSGRFVGIEHVAAPPASFIGRLQRWVFRPWRWCFEGCHTHRDTAQTLQEGPFSQVRIERFDVRSWFVPIRPHISVVATK